MAPRNDGQELCLGIARDSNRTLLLTRSNRVILEKRHRRRIEDGAKQSTPTTPRYQSVCSPSLSPFHLGDACTPMPAQPSWLSPTRIHRTKEREHPGVDRASCHLPSTLQAFGHSGSVNRPNRQVRSSAARCLTRGYRAVLSRDLTASMLHAPGPDVNK